MTHDTASPARLRPDRFRVLRPIGSDGMGVVYEALDRRTNRPLAIKELPSLDADRLYRFKQEFRTLKDVHHPNLVSLYELYEHDGRWFFTMELVAGADFVSAVRGAEGSTVGAATFVGAPPAITRAQSGNGASPPVPIAPLTPRSHQLLRASILQLADGLEAIHNAGKLHRDIKPSNVLIDANGRVVILDFGLTTELSGPQSASFVGTPSYIAPEVIDGVRVAANDWYSVGVMLFVVATGRTPFHDDTSWVRSLMARLARPAPSPSEYVPGTPRWLDKMCAGLLDANPDTRWGARELRQVLRAATSAEMVLAPSTGAHSPVTTPDTGPLRVRSGGHRTKFVGRAAELRRLGSLLKSQGARVAWLHGADGLGKSRLIEQMAQAHEAEPITVLATRVNPEEHVPFRALDGIVDAMSRLLDEQFRFDSTVFEERLAASRLFPVLNPESTAPRWVSVEGDAGEARRAGFVAVRSLIARLCERQPLAFVIDDWHLADRDSRDLLTYVLTADGAPPICLVLASTGPPAAGTFGRRLQGEPSVALLEVALGPLDADEAGELATLLGGGTHTPDSLTAYIVSESGGVPWVIEELAVGFHSSDDATPDPSLDDVMGRKIARLPVSVRRLLETVAVAQPLSCGMALALSGARRAEVRALCGELLLRMDRDGEMVETYHPKIREICLGRVSPENAAEIHLATAELLLEEPSSAPDQIARHLEAAGDVARAAQFLLAAAEQADKQLAFDLAATLYERAVARTPDTDRRRPGRMRLWAMALVNTGAALRGARVLLAASENLPEADRHEVLVEAAVQLIAGGAAQEGLEVARRALAQISYKIPSRASALAHLGWGRARMRLLGIPEAPSQPAADVETRARLGALWRVGSALSVLDVPTGAALVTAHNEAALRVGGQLEVSRALSMEGILTGTLEPVRGAELLRRALEGARGLRDGYAEALAEFGLAVLSFNAGDLQSALQAAIASERRLRRHAPASIWEIHNAQALQLQLLYYLGRVSRLAEEAEELRHGADYHQNLYCQACFQSGWAIQPVLAADQPRRAREMLDSADAMVSGADYVFQRLFKVIGRTSLAIYEDDGVRAFALITEAWKTLERTHVIAWPFLRDSALELRGRAALSAGLASRDPRLIGQARGEASRLLAHGHDPWRRTLAGFLCSGALLAEGKDSEALERLLDAEKTADDAHMKSHVFVARWVRGKMSGDAALQAQASHALVTMGVAQPARYARLLLPWG